MELKAIKGFRDILQEESPYWQVLESAATKILRSWGFHEIKLPILEETSLFKRSIGEETDIVTKEMYSFKDQKGRDLSLRPEATAQVVRAYIQNRLDLKESITKVFTIGPMFRHERPQKGRFRQFHQIDVEIIGDPGPIGDAELIILAWSILDACELKGLSLYINSLGCAQCRGPYKEELRGFFFYILGALCSDCQRRANTNPLRVLDCKVETCKDQVKDTPLITGFLCDECKAHFKAVSELISRASIPFIEDPRLMRGLDYYTRTTFEIKAESLGAQNAVAGGGRYDQLIGHLGGPERPAMGFAIGMDRVVEVMKEQVEIQKSTPKVYIAYLGEQARGIAFSWLLQLRKSGIPVEITYQEASLKAQLRNANRLGATYTIILGEDELNSDLAIIRDMESKVQHKVELKRVTSLVCQWIKNREKE